MRTVLSQRDKHHLLIAGRGYSVRWNSSRCDECAA